MGHKDFVQIFPRRDGGNITVEVAWWHDSTNAFGRMLGQEAVSMLKSLGGPIVDDLIATVLMVIAGVAMGLGSSKTGARSTFASASVPANI